MLSSPNYLNMAGIWKLFKEYIYPRKTWDVWGNHEDGIENFLTVFAIRNYILKNNLTIHEERGGDLLRSWLPVFRNKYEFINRHPCLAIGKLWPLRLFFMNYFILAKKN